MPLGGKLVLKGGETLKAAGGGVQKKKKKAKAAANAAAEGGAEEQPAVAGEAGGSEAVAAGTTAAPPKAKPVNASAVNVQSGHTYEQEFDLETKRGQEGKMKNTPWGSSFRAPPEILHGYTRKVTGANAEERLDLRAAKKSDKFCK